MAVQTPPNVSGPAQTLNPRAPASDGRQLDEVHPRCRRDHKARGDRRLPDITLWKAASRRLDVGIGAPGIVEVFDPPTMRRLETVTTERGAHTLALDVGSDTVYAFLPQTHRAAAF
jgi:hypothetical protein